MPDKKEQDLDAALRRMARLARLEFEPKALSRFVEKARAVISYVEQLSELKTDGIEPTSHAVEMKAALRADEARPSGIESKIIAAAPEREGPYVQVPKVIGGE